MLRVGIIGTGNLATHLVPALQKLDFIDVHKVLGSNIRQTNYFAERYALKPVNDVSQFDDISLIFCLTGDDDIKGIGEKLAEAEISKLTFIHCSGMKGLDIIPKAFNSRGILYPIQSFSRKDHPIDFKEVPICIVQDDHNETLLNRIAISLSDKVYKITQEQKEYLHLSAVFANNFPNHLIHIAQGMLKKREMDDSLLDRLIEKTFLKLQELNPQDAQTGPAIREDMVTIQKHLDLLEDEQLLQNIYETLSYSIIKSKSE